MNKVVIVLVALYRYMNFPLRIIHPLLENIEGIKPYTIFFKHFEANMGKAPTETEEKLFVKQIVDLNPRLIGISVLSPYFPIAKRLTKLIKDNSSALVIWGGIHPTIFPESCIGETDMICVGEGEGAITELARNLRDKKDYRYIKNLWININGHIIRNPMRPLVQDLNALPIISVGNDSFYFVDSNRITRHDPLVWRTHLEVQASRGCPFACSYCVNSLLRPLFRDLGPYTRRRSVEAIISEIKKNQSEWMDHVYFIDETFGDNASWLDEFESRYKKEIGLSFSVEYHPKMVNPEMLSKLVNAGLRTIKVGIQTGSDHIRNHIYHRPGKNRDIIDLSNKIADYGATIRYDLIMDNPYDTEASLEDSINLLLQLPKPLSFNLYSLQYFPGYPLTQKAIKDGHLRKEEMTIDKLMEANFKNWSFVPRRLPYTRKQVLQNVIWLIACGYIRDRIVKHGVFSDSLGSRMCLIYMNFKAIILGKILGVGGIVRRHSWMLYLINGFKHILKGDLKTFYLKIRKHILNKIKQTKVTWGRGKN